MCVLRRRRKIEGTLVRFVFIISLLDDSGVGAEGVKGQKVVDYVVLRNVSACVYVVNGLEEYVKVILIKKDVVFIVVFLKTFIDGPRGRIILAWERGYTNVTLKANGDGRSGRLDNRHDC